MIDWLTGDAINGLGTTIGFFTFLIIGRLVRRWKS
jgi:hypothetical protein